MPLDDTFGGKSAELYISVVDADTWIRAHVRSAAGAAAWERVKDVGVEQEAALREATVLIDAAAVWEGGRLFSTQLREFPRAFRGTYYGSRAEPDAAFTDLVAQDDYLRQQQVAVREATCWQALFLLTEGTDVERQDQFKGVTSSSRGHRFSESQSFGGAHMTLCPAAWNLLGVYEGQTKVRRGSTSL